MANIVARRKAAFFNNLVLLGLNQEAFEKKHGIPFNKDMFNLPNKKGYEIVTHFLFSKLSAATGKNYNIPWPLFSKELDRAFQKTICAHFTNFAQENETRFPRIFASSLSTFGGDRFYEIYLAFSSYVLSKTIRKNGNINLLLRPRVTRENFNGVKEIVQLSTILSQEKFTDAQRATHVNDSIWIQFAKNLSKCLQKLKQLVKANEILLKRYTSDISSLHSTVPEQNFSLPNLIEKSVNCWKPAKRKRKSLENFFSAEEKFWQSLASEVGENVHSEVLNGLEFNIDTDVNLPEQFYLELDKVGFSSSKEDGKLSIVRFLKLLMAYIKSLTQLLNTDMSDLHETCFVNDASSIEDHLRSANSLNKRLSEEVIPKHKENIKILKFTHCFEDLEETSEICSLPIPSYNPEAVKERALLIDPDLEEKLQLPTSEEIVDSSASCSLLPISTNTPPKNISLLDITSFDRLDSTTTVCDTGAGKTDLESSFQQIFVSKKENSAEASRSVKNNVSVDLPSNANLNIFDFDVDFAPSHTFKMRGSWLQEESLNAMTLPDISFDE